MPIHIPVIDLHAQYRALQAELDAAVQRVLQSGWYILGQEVAAFEQEFAAYLQDNNESIPNVGCVGVNSGTDALHLALRACGVGPNDSGPDDSGFNNSGPHDEVITISHTAVATVAAIRLAGATPVLVDIDPQTYTMSPDALAAAITPQTKAIIPVHLYGHPAAMVPILQIAQAQGVPVIEDCAQAHGARYQAQRVGTFGDLACFSFYPTKNLGALGDGGAVVGRNRELLEKVRSLREYGWSSTSRYISQTEGLNSRLDELQAACLRVKLRYLEQWNHARRDLAEFYHNALPISMVKPVAQPQCDHVYHLYVIQLPDLIERDKIRHQLAGLGIGTAIHYPAAIHQQPAYQTGNVICHDMSITEQIMTQILTLPLHPQMAIAQAQVVSDALHTILSDQR